MKKIAVFCGSRLPDNPAYGHHAIQLAKKMAENNLTLIYGGAKIGLMGILADTLLRYHGQVIGVMPTILSDKEIMHPHLSESYIVDSMQARKLKLLELSDAFIALPGGAGTLDEIFEVITLNQIGLHDKPYAFLNTEGYYDTLSDFLDGVSAQGLMSSEHRKRIAFYDDPETLLDQLQQQII